MTHNTAHATSRGDDLGRRHRRARVGRRAGRAVAGAARRRRQSRLHALAATAWRSATPCGRRRIPASARSGDADWMEGDRRPRALLSLVHRRRAARPAAPARPLDRRLDGGRDGDDEPAARSTGSSWWRRSASSRSTARSSTSSTTRRAQLRELTVHDPKTHPRVGRAVRPAAHAGRAGDRRRATGR